VLVVVAVTLSLAILFGEHIAAEWHARDAEREIIDLAKKIPDNATREQVAEAFAWGYYDYLLQIGGSGMLNAFSSRSRVAMRAFLALAGTTTMRKGEVLSLRWDRVHFEDAPYATLVRTKNRHQRHVPIPQSIVKTLKALPSHRSHEHLFPSRPTARCPEPQRPYRWDLGKQFRALAKAAGIQNVRIHDLRHAGATIVMTLEVPDPIVRKVTGHRSRELERYQHLTPELRALTVNLIATELFRGKRARKERESGTPTGTVRGRHVTEKLEGRQRVSHRIRRDVPDPRRQARDRRQRESAVLELGTVHGRDVGARTERRRAEQPRKASPARNDASTAAQRGVVETGRGGAVGFRGNRFVVVGSCGRSCPTG
jgi:hypothetical protein